MRQAFLDKLRIPARQSVCGSSLQSWRRLLNTAVDSNPEVKQSIDELKRSQSGAQEPKLTAEEVEGTINKATAQAIKQARTVEASASERADSQPSGQHDSSYDSASGTERQGSSTASTSGSEQQTHSEGSQRSSHGRWQGSKADDSSSGGSGRRESTKAKLSLSARFKSIFEVVKKEVADAVLPRQETMSATKARNPSIRPAGSPTATGLTIVKQEESKWRKQWTDMQDKLGKHPFFQQLQGLSDNAAFNKGREVADNLRERWETSDSRFVQRIQDMKDNFATESEPAQALREIRSRYPDFDMVHFVHMLKTDVPVVIKAYLEGNLEALKEHSSPEMMERFTGIINAQKAEGLTSDSTILYTSDVELVDIKFVEGDPVVVVQFSCQQINCARDKFGNVVEGNPTDVQRVFYYWALQQEDAGFVGEDGKFHPPRWQLREMLVRGMHNLL